MSGRGWMMRERRASRRPNGGVHGPGRLAAWGTAALRPQAAIPHVLCHLPGVILIS